MQDMRNSNDSAKSKNDARNRPPSFIKRVEETGQPAGKDGPAESFARPQPQRIDEAGAERRTRQIPAQARSAPAQAHARSPETQRRGPKAQAQGTGAKRRVRKKKKRRKPSMILLDLLIAALIIGGLYFLLRPKYDHYMQDKRTNELIKRIEQGAADERTGEIGVWIDPYAHPVNSGGIDLPPGMSEDDLNEALPKPGELVFVQSLARMVIRRIDLNMPVVWGATDASLQVGLGWYPDSAPLEEDGNSVILGHRMWDFGRHFNRLDEVNVGDPIEVFMNDKRYIYRMKDAVIVSPQQMFDYFERGDENVLTLVTCTPKRSFENRLLVFAEFESVEDDTTHGLPSEETEQAS